MAENIPIIDPIIDSIVSKKLENNTTSLNPDEIEAAFPFDTILEPRSAENSVGGRMQQSKNISQKPAGHAVQKGKQRLLKAKPILKIFKGGQPTKSQDSGTSSTETNQTIPDKQPELPEQLQQEAKQSLEDHELRKIRGSGLTIAKSPKNIVDAQGAVVSPAYTVPVRPVVSRKKSVETIHRSMPGQLEQSANSKPSNLHKSQQPSRSAQQQNIAFKQRSNQPVQKPFKTVVVPVPPARSANYRAGARLATHAVSEQSAPVTNKVVAPKVRRGRIGKIQGTEHGLPVADNQPAAKPGKNVGLPQAVVNSGVKPDQQQAASHSNTVATPPVIPESVNNVPEAVVRQTLENAKHAIPAEKQVTTQQNASQNKVVKQHPQVSRTARVGLVPAEKQAARLNQPAISKLHSPRRVPRLPEIQHPEPIILKPPVANSPADLVNIAELPLTDSLLHTVSSKLSKSPALKSQKTSSKQSSKGDHLNIKAAGNDHRQVVGTKRSTRAIQLKEAYELDRSSDYAQGDDDQDLASDTLKQQLRDKIELLEKTQAKFGLSDEPVARQNLHGNMSIKPEFGHSMIISEHAHILKRLANQALAARSLATDIIAKIREAQTSPSVGGNLRKIRFMVDGGDLGTMDVEFQQESSKDQLTIYVENEHSRFDLLKIIPQIETNLSTRGFDFSKVDVEVQDHRNNQAPSQETSNNGTGRQTGEHSEAQPDQGERTIQKRNYGYNTMEVLG